MEWIAAGVVLVIVGVVVWRADWDTPLPPSDDDDERMWPDR